MEINNACCTPNKLEIHYENNSMRKRTLNMAEKWWNIMEIVMHNVVNQFS